MALINPAYSPEALIGLLRNGLRPTALAMDGRMVSDSTMRPGYVRQQGRNVVPPDVPVNTTPAQLPEGLIQGFIGPQAWGNSPGIYPDIPQMEMPELGAPVSQAGMLGMTAPPQQGSVAEQVPGAQSGGLFGRLRQGFGNNWLPIMQAGLGMMAGGGWSRMPRDFLQIAGEAGGPALGTKMHLDQQAFRNDLLLKEEEGRKIAREAYARQAEAMAQEQQAKALSRQIKQQAFEEYTKAQQAGNPQAMDIALNKMLAADDPAELAKYIVAQKGKPSDLKEATQTRDSGRKDPQGRSILEERKGWYKTPGDPNSFVASGDWYPVEKGGQTINVGERAMDTARAKQLVEREGVAVNAYDTADQIGMIRDALRGFSGGQWDVASAALGRYLPGTDWAKIASADDLASSVRTKLATLVRVPGSGQTSNFEMELYLRSIPSMLTQEPARELMATVAQRLAQRAEGWADIQAELIDEGKYTVGEHRKRFKERFGERILDDDEVKFLRGITSEEDGPWNDFRRRK